MDIRALESLRTLVEQVMPLLDTVQQDDQAQALLAAACQELL